MTMIFSLRALFVCLGIAATVMTAGIGSAKNAPGPVMISAKGKGFWDASAGRICPREVGYGKYEQRITVQDI